MTKIGINGFDHTGRRMFRAEIQHAPDLEIVGRIP